MENELITHDNPKSPISEIFRTLRTNIQFMSTEKPIRSILITSSTVSEGKTWIAANLAIAFAQEGKKVIIIDADMRKGRQHRIFEIEHSPGLSNYLSKINSINSNLYDIDDYISKTQVDNLYLLPTGHLPPNPSELLASEETSDLLEKLYPKFDIIIIDGTPGGIVSDSIILSRLVDTTLIVATYKHTKIAALKKLKKDIENVNGKIGGIILNKVHINMNDYKKSNYYYNSEN